MYGIQGEFFFSNKYRLVINHFTDLDDYYSKTSLSTTKGQLDCIFLQKTENSFSRFAKF
jgi:hypothetical protein